MNLRIIIGRRSFTSPSPRVEDQSQFQENFGNFISLQEKKRKYFQEQLIFSAAAAAASHHENEPLTSSSVAKRHK
jgi:hypothetical protein